MFIQEMPMEALQVVFHLVPHPAFLRRRLPLCWPGLRACLLSLPGPMFSLVGPGVTRSWQGDFLKWPQRVPRDVAGSGGGCFPRHGTEGSESGLGVTLPQKEPESMGHTS